MVVAACRLGRQQGGGGMSARTTTGWWRHNALAGIIGIELSSGTLVTVTITSDVNTFIKDHLNLVLRCPVER